MENPVRKKTRKEKKPNASENDDSATQSNENILNWSTYLTYDILRIVFQYLDAKDLASAAKVCRFWLEAANNEKWTRGPCCFIQQITTNYNTYDFLNHIKNIRIKPSIGFFFIPESTPRNIEEHIEALLPKHCEAIMLYSKGIIMDKEMEDHPFPNIVCGFLPQTPNVRIKLFKMAEYHSIIQKTIENQEIRNLMSVIDREKSMSNQICFMLFSNCWGYPTADSLANIIQKGNNLYLSKENEIVSVWGGVLPQIYAHRINTDSCETYRHKILRRTDMPSCVAVVITGAIQTWSTILREDCNTKERVEARLKLFKNEVKLKKHSIGFMFVSSARGIGMYNEANVEPTIFKRLFPKVPLVGCVSHGQYGKTTIADKVNEEENFHEKYVCKSKRPKTWYNDCSTVFLILTYD